MLITQNPASAARVLDVTGIILSAVEASLQGPVGLDLCGVTRSSRAEVVGVTPPGKKKLLYITWLPIPSTRANRRGVQCRPADKSLVLSVVSLLKSPRVVFLKICHASRAV